MNKLPTYVTIDSVRVNIIVEPMSDAGTFEHIDCTIRLNASSPPDVMKRTLIHEVGHAVIYIRNPYLFESLLKMDDRDHSTAEETVIDPTITSFVDVLHQNPDLRRYIFNV